ncbi:MAG: hypothetical protein QW707_04545, partial [Candidatus Bathyarchaeia archaeon]
GRDGRSGVECACGLRPGANNRGYPQCSPREGNGLALWRWAGRGKDGEPDQTLVERASLLMLHYHGYMGRWSIVQAIGLTRAW